MKAGQEGAFSSPIQLLATFSVDRYVRPRWQIFGGATLMAPPADADGKPLMVPFLAVVPALNPAIDRGRLEQRLSATGSESTEDFLALPDLQRRGIDVPHLDRAIPWNLYEAQLNAIRLERSYLKLLRRQKNVHKHQALIELVECHPFMLWWRSIQHAVREVPGVGDAPTAPELLQEVAAGIRTKRIRRPPGRPKTPPQTTVATGAARVARTLDATLPRDWTQRVVASGDWRSVGDQRSEDVIQERDRQDREFRRHNVVPLAFSYPGHGWEPHGPGGPEALHTHGALVGWLMQPSVCAQVDMLRPVVRW